MSYVVTEACVDIKDRACVNECPVDCIYEGPRMLYIHPDECVDCGACEAVCPTSAIVYEDEVSTEADKRFRRLNIEVFEAIGSPGGAGAHGLLADHPEVASLPHSTAV